MPLLSKLFVLLVLLISVPGSTNAQSPVSWIPGGTERWILQSRQIDLTKGGLVLDSDQDQTLTPEFVVLPLFSSDPNVPPLSASDIEELHERNIRVACTVVAGYWDRFAPDSSDFSPGMIGLTVWGDDNYRWIDVRNTGVRQIMARRIELADSIGCDAIDATYLELWYQNTGFFITYGDQLAFNRFLADTAHANGIAIGLHNTSQQIHDLVGWFDFSIVEGCLEAGECMLYTPFQALGKPVFHVEYEEMTWEMHVCNAGRDLGFNTIIKTRSADTRARAC